MPKLPVGMLFTRLPTVSPRTVAVTVHDPKLLVVALVAAGIVPPASWTCVPVKVAEPPHVVDAGPTTVMPAGMTSTKSAGETAARL